MSKNNGNGSNNNPAPEVNAPAIPPELVGAAMAPPEGMVKLESDITGFWDEAAGVPMLGRLLFAREVIPKRGASKDKVKRYYVFRLGAVTMLAENKEKNQPKRPAKPGDIIGVWASAGASDLNRKQGCKVWMVLNPKSLWKDTGKPLPMKTYDIRCEGKGEPIQVIPFSEETGTSAAPSAHSKGADLLTDDDFTF